VPTAQHECIGL